MKVIESSVNTAVDRSSEFEDYAARRFAGEVLTSPSLLKGDERRLYVRHTLHEDHQLRIKNYPEGAVAKFDKLKGELFAFFRGTALLYYRDYAGMDSHLPEVFTVGDIHPENFGVMPNSDDVPFFGVNDFDEATFAPFSLDVKRGATGFYLAAKRNGIKKKHRRKIVKAWVKGYIEGLIEFARDDREKWFQFRLDNSPEMIQDLIEDSVGERADFLEEKIDLKRETFLTTDEIVPCSKRVEEFQGIVNDYVEKNEVHGEGLAEDFFTVKDVAMKRDSGTASLGLDRFWVLLQGRSEAADDDIILEMKQARKSALTGLTPGRDDGEKKGVAEQIVAAQSVHLAGGDRFYGTAVIDDKDFMVRERSPYKNDLDVEDMGKKEMKTYACICGKALAQTHARSDEDTGVMEGDAEKKILSVIDPEIFVDDVIRFAHRSAKQVKRDWKHFKKDHKLGAFSFVRN